MLELTRRASACTVTPGTPSSISFGVVAMRRSSCFRSTWLAEASDWIAVSPVRLMTRILSSSVESPAGFSSVFFA